ncbi:MAG: cupin domain-containing protein [Anaeromyxobacteraceae bacterium]
MTTTEAKVPRVLVRAGERGPDFRSGHPYNPRSEMHGWLLSRPAGLVRIAVNAAFLPPTKESAIFHVHHREEEWMYVLSGRGVAEVDGAEHAVGAGDFLGFPPGVGHHLRNASGEELHYLAGGEIVGDVEVADFPTVRRRLVRHGSRFSVYPLDAEVPFLPPEAEQALSALVGPQRTVDSARALVRAEDRAEPRRYQHAENPRSELHYVPLSRPARLARVAVNLARVPPGRESYVFHLHHVQEEWMFVLSGHGVAEVGDAEHDVGPGDFLGFPAGGPPHHLRNPSSEELVYLMGGDAVAGVEVVDYPRAGKRKLWLDSRRSAVYPLDPR